MENLIKFVPEQLLIVVAALYVLGLMLKNSKVKDWLIPWILLLFGIAGSVAILGFNSQAIIQGFLVTGVAVFSNQLFKQTIEKSKEQQ